ncbi:MAG: hypothetical protein HOF69_06965 [Campylobacteraceae bacterium]|jgi:uncharacterized protein YpbB|nr:hypothetical protein [Campylobacteraceae bacterium]MBT3882982.1 hypothetical protein [Campylobacteraceae bacterium]MBT4030532.1 hypothetical protein [Campylobacteraceae bacterium]MBT4179543.1 hypothetical protein [Campylobacteraceae bacterium]MBT4572224.1 hypothetical protein [Campylobacteraceae bacterium]
MIINLDKNKLYSTFSVSDFSELENSFETLAPSMVEYYLSSLSGEDETYINRSKIQNTVYLDEYTIYLDYDDNTYLEITSKNEDDEYSTGSLW